MKLWGGDQVVTVTETVISGSQALRFRIILLLSYRNELCIMFRVFTGRSACPLRAGD